MTLHDTSSTQSRLAALELAVKRLQKPVSPAYVCSPFYVQGAPWVTQLKMRDHLPQPIPEHQACEMRQKMEEAMS